MTNGSTAPPRRVVLAAGLALGALASAAGLAGPAGAVDHDTLVASPPQGNGLVAFVSDRTGDADIWTMFWDGDHQTNLTASAGDDTDPAWSPDGSKLAFTSDRTGNADASVANADGSNPVNLSSNPAFDGDPAWSPDGSKLAFTSDRTGGLHIWTMRADGSAPTRLTTQATNTQPAWSPNGTRSRSSATRPGTSTSGR